ncbi:putative peptidase [Weissella oryzae SG25]|uniref:Putative peptidase n=1 Tax=Weissella oryzae (strain DSM 25784 / JCM 18191 / LMG 30913 / SG25) TaxID=1329250 RepID=A0A069CUR2_WEIOS|nr:phage tail tip lysozyme [Weissella oryzae]GAK31545.1 putative peptidase [Weissella oryzae SG25]
MEEEQQNVQSQETTMSQALKKLKKLAKWLIPISVLLGLAIFILTLVMIASQGQESCFTNSDTSIAGGTTFDGNWKDKNSVTHKGMQKAADSFKNDLGMSGVNVAAALAIGLRESNFNPSAENPSGAVKGIWQWGAGGINGNRFGNTEATVEAQVALAERELRTSHIKTLNEMKDADLDKSLEAWDVNFEGLSVSDPQRKVSKTTATAKEIKEVFDLNYGGNIHTGNSDADNSSSTDSTSCDGGTGTASGLPIQGQYNITGGYPDYNGETGGDHYGVDFQTVKHSNDGEESNVYAVSDGTVVVKTYDAISGNYVVIKDDSGTYTYYGHAPSQDKIVVNVGDKVKAGQHISHEGETGKVTGIHVHFAVNKMNLYGWAPRTAGLISPAEYLKNIPAQAVQNNGVVVPAGPFDTTQGANSGK